MRQRVGQRLARDVHPQDPRRDLAHQLGGQAERLGIERRVALGLAAERVELGGQMAVRAVGLEQRGGRLDRLHELLVGHGGGRRRRRIEGTPAGRGRRSGAAGDGASGPAATPRSANTRS